MASGDMKTPRKEIREVDPRVGESKNNNGRRFWAVFIFYYATAIFAYSFHLGENDTLAAFARYMESVIPSIHGDAAISPDPDYARLMLAFSWVYMIPAYISFIWNLNKDIDYCEQRGVDIRGLILLAFAVILIGGLWVAGIKPMTPTGSAILLFVYDMAKSFALGITVIGTYLWLSTSASLYVLSMVLPLKIGRMFGKSRSLHYSADIKDKELKNLERHAMELNDPKLREDALRAIAELRSSESKLEGLPVKQVSQIPVRESSSLFETLRLYRDLKSRDPKVKIQAIDEIRLKDTEEDKLIADTRERLNDQSYCNKVMKEFRHSKFLFNCIGLSLIALSIPCLVIAAKCGLPKNASVTLIVLGFYLSYSYVAGRIWRCPACNFKFKLNGRSNIRSCPRCCAML
jgi:hypothetical protein